MTPISRIKILLLCTVFDVKFDKKDVGPDIIDIDGYLFARWYSPVFWAWAVLMLPKFVFVGGLLGWVDWIGAKMTQATWNRHIKYTWSKPTLSSRYQKEIILVTMYLDRKYL